MTQTRVYITTYNVDRNAWLNHQERLLIECHRLSDQKYTLTDDPQDANIILVVDVWEDVWGQGIDVWLDNVGHHPMFTLYPRKSFAISDIDSPVVLHHGIYVGAESGLMTKGRVCSGSYGLYFDYLRNPFIDGYTPGVDHEVPKRYLFSFVGRSSHPVRQSIFAATFDREDILIEDTTSINFFTPEADPTPTLGRQRSYCDVLLQSKFALCPRGSGASSLRLYEAMQLGVAPVIISDKWIPPRNVDWSEFSIILNERDVHHLESIVSSFESSYEEMGVLARQAYDQHFANEVYFNYLVDNCIHIRETQFIHESLYHAVNPIYIRWLKLKNRVRIRSRIRTWWDTGLRGALLLS